MAVGNLVDDSSSVVKETWDDLIDAPAGFTFVALTTIAAVYDGPILQGGTWDGTDYTPPSSYVEAYDSTSDSGMVKDKAHAFMDVMESALRGIQDNLHFWPDANTLNAREGIHWMIIQMARVSLNATRTATNRIKCLDEAASWPTGLNGDPREYVDAMGGNTALPTKDWCWVTIETDPPGRVTAGSALQGFNNATNVETAPGTDKLAGRAWINDIP